MPYLIHIPHYTTPHLLQDRDAAYLKYFGHLWNWRIETVPPDTPGLPRPASTLLHPFHEQDLYLVWRGEVIRRLGEEEEKVGELRKEVVRREKAADGPGGGEDASGRKKKGKRGCLRRWFVCGEKEEREMKVNHLAYMQRRWSVGGGRWAAGREGGAAVQ